MRRRRWLGIATVGVLAAAGLAAGLTFTLRDARESSPLASGNGRAAGPFRPRTTARDVSTIRPPSPWSWSLAKTMQLIDRTRIVGGRRLRVDSETTLCSGVGPLVRRSGVPRWHAFDCTYTTFSGGVDRDLEFRVDILGPSRYVITDVRWIEADR